MKLKKKVTGLEGLNDFSRQMLFEWELQDLKHTIGDWYESNHISLLIDSFNLIQKRIEMSNLSADIKYLFYEKLASYYNCKFKIPFSSLSRTFVKFPNLRDEISVKIDKFVKGNGEEVFAGQDVN